MFRLLFLGVFIFTLPQLSFSDDKEGVPERTRRAQAAIQKALASYGDQVSLSVRDLAGTPLFSHNADRLYSPASVAKLVSSACTLEALGSQFRFSTQIGHTGKIEDGVLKGNLVFRGSGDFSLVIEDFKMIVEQIRFIHGIRSIQGNLVFDTSYFNTPVLGMFSGFERDAGRAFHAPITALPLNHNSFSIWVVPQAAKPRVEIYPNAAVELNIVNQLTSVNGRLGGSRTRMDYRPAEKQLLMSGQVGRQDDIRVYYRSLHDPYESIASLFKFNFESLGGSWQGIHTLAQNVSGVQRLFEHRSSPMSELLINVNKLSTNFGSELSLFAAAEKRLGRPVTAEKARQVLADCIRDFGIDSADMNLDNASGLSRSSRLKPSSLTLLLSRLSSKDYFPEYLVTMSVLGQDGTTRSRLRDHAAKARLKTGSLSGVRSLAGYVSTGPERMLSMSLMLNCERCNIAAWQEVEDLILRQLIEGF